MNVSDLPSTVAFDGLNNVIFGSMTIAIEGSINGSWNWPNNWYAWGTNHVFEDGQGSIEIFTPAYGTTTGSHNKTSIVVRNSMVENIVTGQAPIYGDGYTIVSDNVEINQRFSVGDSLEYRVVYTGQPVNVSTGTEGDWRAVRSAMSCGPTIVENGAVTADGASEGFTESKILTDAAQRSFIGCTADNILIMATVPGVTMQQLGEIALNMGCVYAINLDGGASSGLWYNGSYMTKPGRDLGCAIVVSRMSDIPINILLNGKLVYYNVDPYISNGRTMLPMRDILEDLGAKVFWEGTTQTITAVRGGVTLVMKVGSNIVYKNGSPVTIDAVVELHSGRTCVPVRCMAELFGGSVDFDYGLHAVVVNIN
jgi:hypothetical protein